MRNILQSRVQWRKNKIVAIVGALKRQGYLNKDYKTKHLNTQKYILYLGTKHGYWGKYAFGGMSLSSLTYSE
jgi:hypothetical protein